MWMVQQQGGILLWSHCTGLAGSCFVFVFVSAFVFGLDKQHQKWLAWAHPATESVPWLSWKLFLYLYLFQNLYLFLYLFRNLYLDWIDSTGHPAPESVPWLSWHRAHPSRGTLDGRHKYKY